MGSLVSGISWKTVIATVIILLVLGMVLGKRK